MDAGAAMHGAIAEARSVAVYKAYMRSRARSRRSYREKSAFLETP